MKKLLLTGSGILVAAVIVSVYLLGLHHGSTGEGLAIAKEVVLLHGGNLVLEIPDPKSFRFVISVPKGAVDG